MTHPDQVKGVYIDVARRPVYGFEYGIDRAGNLLDNRPEPEVLAVPSHIPWAPWVVNWDRHTKRKLERIEVLYGAHWQIDFAIDCWNAWQAGEWVEDTGDSLE